MHSDNSLPGLPTPTVSVVIPAYNEEQIIGMCLDALVRQKTQMNFEVIVVNNCSTDGTAEAAARYGDRLNLRVLSESKKGRGAARKAGFAAARADLILSTDADAIVPENWVEAFAGLLKKRTELIAVTGRPVVVDCGPWQNMVFNVVVPACLFLNRIMFGNVGLSGFSFAIWKDVYERAGGFDDEADAYEDLDLANRVSQHGTIAYLHRPPVIFSGRRFQGGLIRGWMEYVRTFLQKFVFKRRKVLLSDVK